jgi:20S proteasome subunit beta 6
VLAVAGESYVICAGDTRMSSGFDILTRHSEKIDEMAPKVLMASAGFAADAVTLKKTLAARCKQYEFQNKKAIGCVSFAQMLSNTLYYKRFFPYYAFNIVAGLDKEGKGAVFTYDAVGSYERTNYSCQGSGQALIMPVLDNQLKTVSPLVLPAVSSATPLSEEAAIELVKDCFATAAERDIYTGDKVELWIMNAEGTRKEYMDLRLD